MTTNHVLGMTVVLPGGDVLRVGTTVLRYALEEGA